jgi:predicted secreted protein
MNDIVNLNKARKAKAREADKAQAAANRVKFGRTKGQQAVTKAEADNVVRLLDGAKREKD